MWLINKIVKRLFSSSLPPVLPIEHDWELISRTYSPPRRDAQVLATLNLNTDVLQQALTGVTTYLWQCKNTGEIKTQVLLGSDKDELQDLVDKVERGGMQYIRMNDNVYAITKWVPPQQQQQPTTAANIPFK